MRAIALIAGAILALTLMAAVISDTPMMHTFREMPIWYALDLLLPLVMPAFAAGSFAREHEQRTWDDVLLTRLRAWEIIGGKFMACLLPASTAIIVLFPPFALILISEGVNWALDPGPWMIALGIKYLSSAFFYIAVVMLCSYYARSGRTALVVGYVVLGLYAIASYFVWGGLFRAYETWVYGDAASYWMRDAEVNTLEGALNRREYQITTIEVIQVVQATVLGMLIMFYLRRRLGKRG